MKRVLSPLFLISFVSIMMSCGRVKDPTFRRLENFGVKKLGVQQTTIGFGATYFNPNSFGVTVKEAALDIYVDSSYLGKFSQTNNIPVKSNSEFSIPLEGKISLLDAVKLNIPALIGKEVYVRANGSIKVGKGGVYIIKDIHYSGKHKLDAALIKNPAGAGSNN